MDWEGFLGLAGIYILLLGIFVHNWIVSKKIFNLEKLIYDMTATNQKVLESIGLLQTYILDKVHKEWEKEGYEKERVIPRVQIQRNPEQI